MGMRFGSTPGPKPKKNALKTLATGARLVANDEVQPKAGVPSCPNWLSQAGKTEWRRILLEFATVPGWITLADRSVLASYCQHGANWRNAEEHVAVEGAVIDACDKHGNVIGTKANPFVAIAQKESELMTKAGDRLGLSPGARSTLHVIPKQQGSSADPLMPPRATPPPHISVEHKKARTIQPDPPDPIVEVPPEPEVEVQPDPVPDVPVANAVPDPTGTSPEDVQEQGEVVAEASVEDPAAGASNNQDGQPADLPVEPLAAGAVVEEQPVDQKVLEEQRRQERLRAWLRGISS